MSDIIRLLPDSVANQIAAGEVIQRPASVIKELVENAVDAGATDIRIFIRDAGRTLIQVVDNGKGMTETDARMAFERHATSKIAQADDLFTLHTMGFRGEGLPSICAIAQIELKTRTADDQIGTRLVINASKVEMQEPSLCEPGSNIMVKNLFFNVPARRKFLKSDSVETANIMREFERLALVNNNIRLSIDRDGKTLDLRPGSFKQRIADIWKNNINLQLLPVEVDTSLVKISGFVSRPENARRRNALQYLIVNGRNMRHPYFHRAIISCYESLIPADSQPCYFIKFDVDPQTIDVNIHPTKNEIKFENEQQIWPILVAAVRASLGKFAAVPSIDFTDEALPLEPLRSGETPSAPQIDLPGGYNPFERYSTPEPPRFNPGLPKRSAPSQAYKPTRQSGDWESLYSSFMKQAEKTAVAAPAPEETQPALPIDMESNTPICVQFALKYIITTSRDGLLIIDQHRAHAKILFEAYVSSSFSAENASQQVLFPETLTLDHAQQATLEEVQQELARLGFGLEHIEGNSWHITAVPSDIRGSAAAETVIRILDAVSDESATYGKETVPTLEMRRRMAAVMARSAAIKRGVKLSSTEMEHLVSDLFSLPAPALTPEGNPVYRIIETMRIENLF